MDASVTPLQDSADAGLWPLVEAFVGANDVAGIAVAVVRDGETAARGFGVRDVRTGSPVTPETIFHLASVSKPFVATAIASLATGDGAPINLDAPITDWVPEFTLADGRAGEITCRTLMSHSSGLPDVSDYRWYDPQLGDDALADFASSLSGWRLKSEPGSAYAYSNAGYELLGLVLARAAGTTFEVAMRQHVLDPLGLRDSTFLRAEVPERLAARPHVGLPLAVPGDAYPYTRCHAPSSTLHSNLVEMCRWMAAHLAPAESRRGGGAIGDGRLDAGLLDLMWQPVMAVGHPPWDDAAGLGWAVGSYRGQRTLSHSGADPGFGSRFVLVPERRTGVVVLANSNTIPASSISMAALDVALADAGASPSGDGTSAETGAGVALRGLLPPLAGPVARTLAESGPDAAVRTYDRLVATEAGAYDLDDEGFVDAVWGAIELHRTDMVWPLLGLWSTLRPDSSPAWTMTGWAHQVDGDVDRAESSLRRALDLDPDNDEAADILRSVSSA